MNTQSAQSLPASRSRATLHPHPPTLTYRLVLLSMFAILGLAGEAFAEWQHTVIKHFGPLPNRFPYSPLVTGADGRLYGTTRDGGASGNYGTVYAINADGTGFTTLHSFARSDGAFPTAGLTRGADGRLYGTTMHGGASDYGTVYAINADGTEFTTLHSFAESDGSGPWAGLATGADGRLYGTTHSGGAYGYGTVFAINANGTGFETLHSFAGSDGAGPYAGLTTGADGRLYGTTHSGGAYGYGAVFAINADGTGFETLHSFAGSNGAYPFAGLATSTDGLLYGMTYSGGAYGYGTVFAINADGTGFESLHSFARSDGANPYAGLATGVDGRLYGTTAGGGASGYGTVFAINADGTGFETLHSFAGSDGTYPYGGLTIGADSRLYGTTLHGGTSNCGTVFAINADGTGFETLHSFAVSHAFTYAGLTTGADGRLYGTNGGAWEYGGKLFAINPNGTGFETLHSFARDAAPVAGLTVGADGRLYGTTVRAGDNPFVYGTVFAINADGTGFTTLHSFASNDGANPRAGLTTGADGRLYGSTVSGGASDYGTVFAINADGTGFETLHSFAGSDGAFPYAGLTTGADGRLYGTTSYDVGSEYGTVFAITADGTQFTTLHFFAGSDGAGPSGGLTVGADGRLYGTAGGGAYGYGTVFAINADGTGFETLHSFTGNNGASPVARLAAGADGRLYGTTHYGGVFNVGTLFCLSPSKPLTVTVTDPPSGYLQQVNQGVGFEGFFTPTGASGSYTAKWTFTSDMLAVPIEVPGIVTGTTVSRTQAFSTPGLYAVTLTVTDPAGVSASTNIVGGDPNADAFVVIYDSNGGFVTGSGWIWSPAGAFTLDPSQEGRAHFHSVAKYKKGATVPHGKTEFQFKAGGLKFALTDYQWLVVAGSDAKLMGTGTINGLDGFGIMLTARDGGAAGSDKVRIKIWDLETDGVIYHNQLGAADDAPLDASTVLKGGNITVHTK